MNDRLLNHPKPPREADPQVALSCRKSSIRALERDPKSRYRSAREFAWDLAHLDQVGVAGRPELRDWKRRRTSWAAEDLFYLGLALIPVSSSACCYTSPGTGNGAAL